MKSDFFKRYEFACKCGCGFDTIDTELLDVLHDARAYFDAPIKIVSGCRCLLYNRHVGGSLQSKHCEGRAADIVVEGVEPWRVQLYFDEEYGDKFGVGRYPAFTHIDTRSGLPARWRQRP